jgi:hypothetical protein
MVRCCELIFRPIPHETIIYLTFLRTSDQEGHQLWIPFKSRPRHSQSFLTTSSRASRLRLRPYDTPLAVHAHSGVHAAVQACTYFRSRRAIFLLDQRWNLYGPFPHVSSLFMGWPKIFRCAISICPFSWTRESWWARWFEISRKVLQMMSRSRKFKCPKQFCFCLDQGKILYLIWNQSLKFIDDRRIKKIEMLKTIMLSSWTWEMHRN